MENEIGFDGECWQCQSMLIPWASGSLALVDVIFRQARMLSEMEKGSLHSLKYYYQQGTHKVGRCWWLK